ncbi:MAG TPA: arginine--tRNA ligase [Aggregatilinea sp.]|uniref:arginine--tRNA ligase n=1 Tax=Aggregatilinea sp. TaxID=2806333 RepID=UPI002CE619D9|nr:arginine--tRNA ligase [Aggregatilinea sp.]HML21471.1 arginine--tRNA ligase [Aggregatilinea sp.]
MNPIPNQLAVLIRDALASAQAAGELPTFDLPESIPVQRSAKPELGDYASPVAMQLAKPARQAPLAIAQKIAAHLTSPDYVTGIEVAAPGFLNFRLDPAWLLDQVEAIIAAGDAVFTLDIGAGQTAQVECVSANPTGPITVGRTRGGVIGSTMANVLTALGYTVQMEYYFNNAGRQMEMLGRSVQARYLEALGLPFEFPEAGYQGDYIGDIARDLVAQHGDALKDAEWKAFKDEAERSIFAWIERSLARVSMKFDHFFNENSVYESGAVWRILEQLEQGGYVYRAVNREGASEEEIAKTPADAKEAVWFRSTMLGDEEDRVLVKSSGEPTYVLPDIAYHVDKLDRGFAYLINVLGTDHIIEAQTVARGLQAIGRDPRPVHVLLHQFVTLFEGGEARKMSTRRGEYVTLDELVEDVGADVVRYFILARSPNSHLEFDLDLARQQANENPVYYIQNAHVRCAGIFRQAAEQGLTDDGADLSLLGEPEQAFLRKMLELPEVLVQAYDELAPHKVAFYALDLARQFHPLYEEVRVLHSEVPADVAKARLRFYRAAQIVFKRVLMLMGMSAPEVM